MTNPKAADRREKGGQCAPFLWRPNERDRAANIHRTAGSDSVIELHGLSKSYAANAIVLDRLNLVIGANERVALIGANGSGKSTLLKCILGLHESSAGSVTTLGETFSQLPSAQQRRRLHRRIGFVFQRHGLVQRLSALSNVVHGMLGYPGSWRAVVQPLAPAPWRHSAMQVLTAVGLEHKALDRVDSLSGGQQQRVAIARALVRRPQLMIADEPAASLDPTAGRDVMALFSDLVRRHGITLLFTSHDMDHAISFADRVIALKAGSIHFDRPACDITSSALADVFDD